MVLWFVVALWVIHIVDTLFDLQLARLGVYPGEIAGLKGVLFAPLIHGSFVHVFSNTLPLLVLGTAMLVGYPRSSKFVFPIIYFGTGVMVWLFGRESFHIGASGLSFGFLTFVFVIGALRWDKQAIALSCLVFFLYGGMIWGIFPSRPGISFESHLFGSILGVLCAIIFRNYDPRPPKKRYDWEDEPEQSIDSDESSGPTLH
ncbi:MAG: rhomboid family intramembrane serine protease [Gammaproteobacteria bacterium]|jgi:membrane associated rhomboid family serine protease